MPSDHGVAFDSRTINRHALDIDAGDLFSDPTIDNFWDNWCAISTCDIGASRAAPDNCYIIFCSPDGSTATATSDHDEQRDAIPKYIISCGSDRNNSDNNLRSNIECTDSDK